MIREGGHGPDKIGIRVLSKDRISRDLSYKRTSLSKKRGLIKNERKKSNEKQLDLIFFSEIRILFNVVTFFYDSKVIEE